MKSEASRSGHPFLSFLTLLIVLVLLLTAGASFLLYQEGVRNPDTPPSLFGVMPFLLDSDEMHGVLEQDDLVFAVSAEATTLKKSDSILFRQNDTYLARVILSVGADGLTVCLPDGSEPQQVAIGDVLGRCAWRIPSVGALARFTRTPLGLLLSLLLPLMIYAVYALIRRLITVARRETVAVDENDPDSPLTIPTPSFTREETMPTRQEDVVSEPSPTVDTGMQDILHQQEQAEKTRAEVEQLLRYEQLLKKTVQDGLPQSNYEVEGASILLMNETAKAIDKSESSAEPIPDIESLSDVEPTAEPDGLDVASESAAAETVSSDPEKESESLPTEQPQTDVKKESEAKQDAADFAHGKSFADEIAELFK